MAAPMGERDLDRSIEQMTLKDSMKYSMDGQIRQGGPPPQRPKNGLSTFTPIIYRNPADDSESDSDSDSGENPGPPPVSATVVIQSKNVTNQRQGYGSYNPTPGTVFQATSRTMPAGHRGPPPPAQSRDRDYENLPHPHYTPRQPAPQDGAPYPYQQPMMSQHTPHESPRSPPSIRQEMQKIPDSPTHLYPSRSSLEASPYRYDPNYSTYPGAGYRDPQREPEPYQHSQHNFDDRIYASPHFDHSYQQHQDSSAHQDYSTLQPTQPAVQPIYATPMKTRSEASRVQNTTPTQLQSGAPTNYSPAPTNYSPAPNQPHSAPANYSPAPSQPHPAPTNYSLAPTQPHTAPTNYSPAPTQPHSAPTNYSPAPTQSHTAPTNYSPAPTQPHTAPTSYSPAPTGAHSAPTTGNYSPAPNQLPAAPTDYNAPMPAPASIHLTPAPATVTRTVPAAQSSVTFRTNEPVSPKVSGAGGHRGSGPEKSLKEAEVDALTNLLLQNMEATKHPDYYGMCQICHQVIIGEDAGCTALDQVYHVTCFLCTQCEKSLKGSPFFAMEGRPYCEDCYMNTLEKCSVCSKPITDRILRATGKPYHPQCFTCVVCGKSLDGIPFTVDATNQIHCIEDFHRKFAPRCCLCRYPIMPEPGKEETVRVVAMDRSFHVGCYKCEDCGLVLSSEAEGRGCYPLDDHLLCKSCNAKRIQAMTTKMTTEL